MVLRSPLYIIYCELLVIGNALLLSNYMDMISLGMSTIHWAASLLVYEIVVTPCTVAYLCVVAVGWY